MKKERTKGLPCERARAFPIGKALAKLGHFPTKTNEKEAWFLSPFRSETQASFKVSKKLNRWYDHGEGTGGNVIDLICLINKWSVKEVLRFLNTDQISHIRIWVVNEQGERINLRSEDLNVTLSLKLTRRVTTVTLK